MNVYINYEYIRVIVTHVEIKVPHHLESNTLSFLSYRIAIFSEVYKIKLAIVFLSPWVLGRGA